MANVRQLVERLLSIVVKEGASDLHIAVGRHPTIRMDGVLTPLLKEEVMTADAARAFIFELTSPAQQEKFLRAKELDFSYDFQDRARFRVNVFH